MTPTKTKIGQTVFVILIFLFPGMYTFDSIKTMFTAKPTVGVIVDCESHFQTNGFILTGGQWQRTGDTLYAPMVQTPKGEMAYGKRHLNARCDDMVGQKTLAFIHPADPEKNRVGSFTQLWLMPSLLLMGIFWVWVPVMAIKTPATIIYAVIIFLGFRMDYGKFNFLKAGDDEAVMSAEATLKRCANRFAGFDKLDNPHDLKRLSCSRLHDLSGLVDYPNLESLMITKSEITSLESLPYSETLKKLDLYQTEIDDISDLPTKAPNLEELLLRDGPIKDISAVSELKHLRNIQVVWTKIDDISALQGKETLERATFLSPVTDLSPLYGLPNLKLAGAVDGRTKIDCDNVSALKDSLRDDAVVWTPDHCK